MRLFIIIYLCFVPNFAHALIADISKDTISIAVNFTGEKLLVFGSIEPSSADIDSDVIVIVRGPLQDILMRKKARVGGIWLNRDSHRLGLLPSFYALAATRDIVDIIPQHERDRFEIGAQYLRILNPQEQVRPYRDALIRLREAKQLYTENMGGVRLIEGQLFRSEISLPASVPLGTYHIEFLHVKNGRVIDKKIRDFIIDYSGIEHLLHRTAFDAPFIYGSFGVFIAVVMGWGAANMFRNRR